MGGLSGLVPYLSSPRGTHWASERQTMGTAQHAFSDTVTTFCVYNGADPVDVNRSIFTHRLWPVYVLECQVTFW